MRIAHLSDCYLPRLGGIEMQVHDLAVRQRVAGHEVEVLTATPDAGHEPAACGADDPVPVHRLTANLPWELPVHPRAGRAVLEVLQRGGYDVAHVHAGVVSPFAYAAAPAAVRAGVPTVVTVHCMWGPLTPAFRLLDRAVRWSSWPVVLSAVSDAAAVAIRGIVGPGVEVGVLPNGIDPADWYVDPLPRDPDEVHLVAVMRLAPRKRPLQLLRMLRAVRELVPAPVRLRATVLGEGPARASLERYLRRHGMTGWVHLPGRCTREQIRQVYRRADVFVAPANLESFGIAALEARCAGLPVVAKAHSGIRDFVVHGQEGLLAATDAEMVDALVRLSRSPGLRGEITRHNRAVPPKTTWQDVLDVTEAAYKRAGTLLAPGRPPLPGP